MIGKLIIFAIVFAVSVLARPEEEAQKDRVYNRELSDKEHFENEHHNPEYDHEAFLGEEAKTFDQLTPEESKRRLGYVLGLTYCVIQWCLYFFQI